MKRESNTRCCADPTQLVVVAVCAAAVVAAAAAVVVAAAGMLCRAWPLAQWCLAWLAWVLGAASGGEGSFIHL